MKGAQLRQQLTVAIVAVYLILANHPATANDSVQEFYDQTTFEGEIRNYFFTRDYTNPDTIDQAAYSLGGHLGMLTGPIANYFKIGAVLYTAQPLGLNSDNPLQVDNSLPGDAVTVLGQAFLQYNWQKFLVRAGDQKIDTPWLNSGDTRMIPATYRGFYGIFTPQHWTFSALRIYEFKSRVANHFSATNLYNPANLGIPIPGLDGITNPGASALAAEYKTDSFAGRLWGYQFFNFGKLLYGDAQYTWTSPAVFHPLVAMQALVEGGDGDNILAQVSTGKANATAIGTLAGVETDTLKLTFAYNKIPPHQNAYNNGDIVSPYTASFASYDALYTTSMIAGLVEKTVGDAIKIAGTYYAFNKQLSILLSFAKYYTQPYLANTNETDFDVTYSFKQSKHKYLTGLSLRNRLGIETGDPTLGTFYYNRVMLTYSF